MKKILIMMMASLPLGVSAQGKPRLIEKVGPSKDGLVIPYQKWEFPNGLTLLIHEDHSDPIVHVDVTYHVGSQRELAGRSGFAHFFEHMMFQGSENVPDEAHFKIITESGGTLNGTTNLDRTNYFQTLPNNQLEVALWLEADRMGFFLDAVTQEKFEIQRATVKNERGQNYDNRPYGLVYEKTIEALYPAGHPYSWTTIGYIEDLNAATLDDLKRFFLRWYGPNNATLTVAGDVKPEEVLRLVNKYFGSIPRGPEVMRMKPHPANLKESRFISYEDNIRAPLLQISYPTVEARHADEIALDALAYILGDGKSSIMYNHLVKTKKARSAYAYNPASELAGVMQFSMLAYPGQPLQDLLLEFEQVLAAFEARGVSDADVRRYQAREEKRELQSLQTVRGKASKLAYYQTFTGNPNYIVKDFDRLKALKPEDVIRVYNTYIKGKAAVLLSVVPKGQRELLAGPDTYVHERSVIQNDLSEYEGLAVRKAKDNFDRSKQPGSGPNPIVSVPTFWKGTAPSGLKMMGSKYDELPMGYLQITFPAGHYFTRPEKAGLANLLASMLNEASTRRSAEDMADTLEMLGSSIQFSASGEELVVGVSFLNRNARATFSLLQERLEMPAFLEEDFERLKTQQLDDINNQANSAPAIASNILRRLLFRETIYGIGTSGQKETVENITLEDVKSFYREMVRYKFGQLVYLGSQSQKEFELEIPWMLQVRDSRLSSNPSDDEAPKMPAVRIAPQQSTTVYFHDKQGAAQSEIRFLLPGPMFDATGTFYRLNLMNYPLGGAFNSRLNLNLREDKGYTYGVRSGFTGNDCFGYFYVSGGFLKDATDSAIIEIMNEFRNLLKEGFRQNEIRFTQNSIGQRDALNYESMGQKAGFLAQILRYGLPDDFISQQRRILEKFTLQEANSLMKEWINPRQLRIIVVGDKETVWAKLESLGFPIVEVDVFGNPL